MKIAFWSNERGICANTTNLALFSIWHALNNPMATSVILENHKSSRGIDRMLYKPRATERSLYFRSGGLGSLLRKIGSGKEPTVLELDAIADRYIGERLLYFPIGPDMGPEQLNYHLEHHAESVFDYLEKRRDIVWIDLRSGEPSTRQILESCDRVVINLTQNRTSLEQVFRNYRDLHEKAFYLIGNYDDNSDMSLIRISSEYGIPITRIAVIPHNSYLFDAISKGVLIPFLMRALHAEADDVIYDFSLELRQAAGLLFDWLSMREESVYEKEFNKKITSFVANSGSGLYLSANPGEKSMRFNCQSV